MAVIAKTGLHPAHHDTRLIAEAVSHGITPHQELEHFISRYLRANPIGTPRAPDLLDSLGEFAPMQSRLGQEGRLPNPCRCLIEGYAAPDNALHLRAYLSHLGLTEIDILAVDIYDLVGIYAQLGRELPAMRYRLADARDLRGVIHDASIDLVIQDFLVNCMNPNDVPTLFEEVRRTLSPNGLALISFTDDHCMDDVEIVDGEYSSKLPANPEALIISHQTDRPQGCLGRRFQLPQGSGWGFVTPPHGRLEFFSPLAHTLNGIRHQGLKILSHSVSRGLDDHGLRCVRHRCILAHK